MLLSIKEDGLEPGKGALANHLQPMSKVVKKCYQATLKNFKHFCSHMNPGSLSAAAVQKKLKLIKGMSKDKDLKKARLAQAQSPFVHLTAMSYGK